MTDDIQTTPQKKELHFHLETANGTKQESGIYPIPKEKKKFLTSENIFNPKMPFCLHGLGGDRFTKGLFVT